MVLPGREYQRVLHERAVRVFQRHRELGGDDRADQDGLARAHCECQDITGVGKGEGFAEGLELEIFYKDIVCLDSLEKVIDLEICRFESRVRNTERFQQRGDVLVGRKYFFVKIKNVGRFLNQPEIPVRFEGLQLRPSQKTQIAGFCFSCPFQHLGYCRIIDNAVACGAPAVYTAGNVLVKMDHSTPYASERIYLPQKYYN